MFISYKPVSVVRDLVSQEVFKHIVFSSMLSSVRRLRSGNHLRMDAATDSKPDKNEAKSSTVIPKEIKKKNATSLGKKKQEKNENLQSENLEFKNDVMYKMEVSQSIQKPGVSPRKRKQVKEKSNYKKVSKEIKLKTASNIKSDVPDIENAAWEPNNWRKVYENILEMRKHNVAPVDSLGCEECPDKNVSPEVFRYQTLISVMLSSQTRDEVTHAASQRLIEHGLTVDNILKTPDEKIGELIYPAGFWKSKVKYIKQTTQILKDQYNGDIPRTFKELCKLPGVGPKMANIVMSVGWNDTVGIAVDTHVHRISNRLGWVKKLTKDPEQTRKELESWLPKIFWKDATLQLVGFGQTICKPVKPKCQECLNIHLCPIGKSNMKK